MLPIEFGSAIILFVLLYVVIPLTKRILINRYWKWIQHLVFKAASYSTNFEKEEKLQTCYGVLDGFEEDRSIWVTLEKEIVKINLIGKQIFILPSRVSEKSSNRRKDKPVFMDRIHRRDLPRLSLFLSKPKVFAAGKVFNRHGVFELESDIVVFYDGSDEHLIERILNSTCSRQSVVSFLNLIIYGMGMIISSIIAYVISSKYDNLPEYIKLMFWSLLVYPLMLMIPPSIFFLYLYRKNLFRSKEMQFKELLTHIRVTTPESVIKIKKNELKQNCLNSLYLGLAGTSAILVSNLLVYLLKRIIL